MQEGAFKRFLGELQQLTPDQRRRLTRRLNQSKGDAEIPAVLARKAEEPPMCPKCGVAQATAWGRIGDLPRWRCAACGRTFNALSGTALARLRTRDKWLAFAEQMALGTSVRACAKLLEINRNTAFAWRHKFLAAPRLLQARGLKGIVEANETSFPLTSKGRKRKTPRSSRERVAHTRKPGPPNERVPVLVARDRRGALCSSVIENTAVPTVIEALRPVLAPEAILCTKENAAYSAAAATIGCQHRSVNPPEGTHVDVAFHVENVDAVCDRLQIWMKRFRGVAPKYLDNYLGWHRLLERVDRPNPRQILGAALSLPTTNIEI